MCIWTIHQHWDCCLKIENINLSIPDSIKAFYLEKEFHQLSKTYLNVKGHQRESKHNMLLNSHRKFQRYFPFKKEILISALDMNPACNTIINNDIFYFTQSVIQCQQKYWLCLTLVFEIIAFLTVLFRLTLVLQRAVVTTPHTIFTLVLKETQ